jgi:UPF0716 protein FxsA
VRLLLVVLVLVSLPVVELLLLVDIARHIGTLATIGLIAGTGIGGLLLARQQGMGMLARLRRDLAEGRSPGGPIVDGALILVAAVALVLPGVVTDLVGMLLLVPAGRRLVTRFVKQRFARAVRRGRAGVAISTPGGYDAAARPPMKNVTPRAPNDEAR